MKVTLLFVLFCLCSSQDYTDFTRTRPVRSKRSRPSITRLLIGGIATFAGGYFAGSYITGARVRKQHQQDKEDLIQFIQLQDEVYKQRDAQWQAEYQKLYAKFDALDRETQERDYEEFKAPDTDGDDVISRTEYLSSFPELSNKDFPSFEEFDTNQDGFVSFSEWQEFLKQQRDGTKKKTSENNYEEVLEILNQPNDSS